MGEKRSYGQYCTVARALDVVGERWTLLLVRELSTGPKRFKDLLEGLPGIGTNLLANRLKTYEFRIDGEAFHVRVRDGEEGERVEVRQGSVPDPDLVVTGDAETFLAVASGRLNPEEVVQSGALWVEGEREEDREALLAWCQSLVRPAAA
jgi:DNA-binding HxlR family transcriptional regulator